MNADLVACALWIGSLLAAALESRAAVSSVAPVIAPISQRGAAFR